MSVAVPVEHALAVYGTLKPGESNHQIVAGIKGEWSAGIIRGYLFEIGWGPAEGYPGLVPHKKGNEIPVGLLISPDLPRHWDRLDCFEGPGYRRRAVDVWSDDVVFAKAFVYEALTQNE